MHYLRMSEFVVVKLYAEMDYSNLIVPCSLIYIFFKNVFKIESCQLMIVAVHGISFSNIYIDTSPKLGLFCKYDMQYKYHDNILICSQDMLID
jgi:hypothetical protein